jgi:hypothetical protein
LFIKSIFVLGATAVLAAQDTSAILSGELRDGRGNVIRRVDAELRLEESPHTVFSVRTDDGKFRFTLLPPGTYTLILAERQFRTLTLKSIQLPSGEQKALAPLRLEAAGSCGSGGPLLEYVELLPVEPVGNLSGRVERDEAHPIAHATVKLLCDARRVCGETKTDPNGAFIFFDLLPRDDITLRVTHPGFYSEEGAYYEIRAGFNSTYAPIVLNSRLRPKPPVVVCE